MRGQQERLQRDVALCTVPADPRVRVRSSRRRIKSDLSTLVRNWERKSHTSSAKKQKAASRQHVRPAFVKAELSEFDAWMEGERNLVRDEAETRRREEMREETNQILVRNLARAPRGIRELLLETEEWAELRGEVREAVDRRQLAGDETLDEQMEAQWLAELTREQRDANWAARMFGVIEPHRPTVAWKRRNGFW